MLCFKAFWIESRNNWISHKIRKEPNEIEHKSFNHNQKKNFLIMIGSFRTRSGESPRTKLGLCIKIVAALMELYFVCLKV